MHCDRAKYFTMCTEEIAGHISERPFLSNTVVQKAKIIYPATVCPCTPKDTVNDGAGQAPLAAQLKPKQC